jgi:hypothetical protein
MRGARERREAALAAGMRPPAVMPRTKLKRATVRTVEVEKPPLLVNGIRLEFHPRLRRVGMVPSLIAREDKLGRAQGKSRGDHKDAADTLTREFEALVASIADLGIREPLKVVADPKRPGWYYIADGRHRFEAGGEVVTRYLKSATPALAARARQIYEQGYPCQEIPEEEVSATILASVNRRHYSKGAIAYLAVLIRPEVATEAKRGGDRKSNRSDCGLITAETLAAQAGVATRTLEYAIRLYKIFSEREDLRLKYEPGIWVGNALDRVWSGVEGDIKGPLPPDGAEPGDMDHSPAEEGYRRFLQRIMALEISWKSWDKMHPQRQEDAATVIASRFKNAPEAVRAAIVKTLTEGGTPA